jgi:hypothetical protein
MYGARNIKISYYFNLVLKIMQLSVIAQARGIPQHYGLYPYHIQRVRYRVLGDHPCRVRFCGTLQLQLQILRDIPFIDQFNFRGGGYYQHKGFALLGKCKSQPGKATT